MGQGGEIGLEHLDRLNTCSHHSITEHLPTSPSTSLEEELVGTLPPGTPSSRVCLTPIPGAARSSLQVGMALWKQLCCCIEAEGQASDVDGQATTPGGILHIGLLGPCTPSLIHCSEMPSGSLEPPGKP